MIEILNVRATNNPNEFLVNGMVTVDISVVQDWIDNKNEVMPPMTDADIKAINQAEINADALEYLASTDWYIVRFAETGTPIPSEVVTARSEARAKIVK